MINPMSRYIARTLFALLLIVASAPLTQVSAAVYKFVGDDGKVSYSQTPPVDRPFTVVETTRTNDAAAARAREAMEQAEAGFNERRDARKDTASQAKADAEDRQIRERNCAAARKNLAALQKGGRLNIKEGDKYRTLSEEERQERITEANEQVAEFCK